MLIVTIYSIINLDIIKQIKTLVDYSIEVASLYSFKEKRQLDYNVIEQLKGRMKAVEVKVVNL